MMMRSYGRGGIAAAKLACWLQCNSRLSVASPSNSLSFAARGGSVRAVILYVSGNLARCRTFSTISRRNPLALHDSGRRGYAIKVNGSVMEPTSEDSDNGASSVDATESRLHGAEEIVMNSQQVDELESQSLSSEDDDDSKPWTALPQAPGEPEHWWRIPDFIHEVLPLPKNFNLQHKLLYNKLGYRIHSRELLLRILHGAGS